MSVASEKYLDPGTEANYLEFAKQRKFQPDSLVLSDGTKAHWVGPRKADKIFVFYHGEPATLSRSAIVHYEDI